MSKIEVKTISLDVNDKKIELSLKEALELKKILNDTFPEKETVYLPSAPIIIDRWEYPQRPYDIWYCDYNDGSICLSNNAL